MGYAPYITKERFLGLYGGVIPEEDVENALRKASRHIDSLTYNRIVGQGFFHLSEFQRDVIQEVTAELAIFEHENADLIESMLSGYSLNGASVQFGQSWNVFADKGIAMPRSLYALLCQTGLCCRLAR
ncbi:hypothetical protein HW273_05580 [Oribacterium sp. oral taxon 102]|uniref:hypothetical protein n=1 Tax=Oribacterium sp. oral taxon 102 TaxID=671214 RepID=UPI0015BB64E8|nr:hypothetical protein [Oribacterium sp. oral taxon 102]NWO21365.1 hypothetical protein [Oribacterium sp. oral taxon 102]